MIKSCSLRQMPLGMIRAYCRGLTSKYSSPALATVEKDSESKHDVNLAFLLEIDSCWNPVGEQRHVRGAPDEAVVALARE